MTTATTQVRDVTADISDEKIKEFLIARGGPFYELQRYLGLLHDDALRVVWRAFLFVAAAWAVPLLLSVLFGQAWGSYADHPFLLDAGTWAKYLISTGAFVLTEQHLEQRLKWCLQEFTRAPILAPSSYEDAAVAINTSNKRRDSRPAEILCLLAAMAITICAIITRLDSAAASWAVQPADGVMHLTAAGWWSALISVPIFWFLLLRSLWRHLVWSLLLRKLAKLKLRIVVSHPDGNGGLGFIGRYPNAYTLFVFGVSSIVASGIVNQLVDNNMSTTTYGYILSAWLAIVLALFAFPLSAFTFPLAQLKRRTQLVAGAQATRFHRLGERKIFGSNIACPDDTETPGSADVTDPSKYYDPAKKLSVYLVSRSTLFPVVLCAVLPLAAAGLTKMPYKEILSIAKKLLLL